MVQARDHYPRDILRQIDAVNNTSEDITIDDEHTNLS